MASKAKNIVLCLDGTGNQIEENLSNVLKLYRSLEKSDKQVVFYDQGVGTLGLVSAWGRIRQKLRTILGLAFGLGLDENVLQAYEFIVQHYQEYRVRGQSEIERDRIFIFGFSRGAYSARVLAGLLYEIGILRPNQIHLSGAALTAYKQSKAHMSQEEMADDSYEGTGANFRRVAATRTASVAFMGLWDTVSSVFIPNPKGVFPPITRQRLPHTSTNPAVQAVRHAMAVDECRRMFRVDRWTPGQSFKPNPHSRGVADPQDVAEMWFAGCHSDVGGGYARQDSGLSQFPLIWMISEAEKTSDLRLSKRMAAYVTGQKKWSRNTTYIYPKPDVVAPLHDSLTWYWLPAEYLPKAERFKEWPDRHTVFGYYLPMAEPRFIAEDDAVHPSVRARMAACPEYSPVNVPHESREC